MDLDITEEQKMLKIMASDFLEKECPKSLVREIEASQEKYSPKLWKNMAELGWLGLVFPEEYGGSNGNFLDLIILLEEMGRNIVPGPFLSTVVSCGLPILNYGTEEQKKAILPKISSGDLIVALALIEPSDGYDYSPSAISVEAKPDGDDFVINGTKLFVAGASVANYLLVAVRTGVETAPRDGISLFLVDAQSSGISCEIMPTIALDGQCEVTFKDVRAPKDSMVGKPNQGWQIIESILTWGTVAKCAEMLGGARAILDMSLNYAKERQQYSRPIGGFQVIQHYLANMQMDINGIRSITYETSWKVSEGIPCAKEVSIAKAWVNETYRRIAELGIRIHGAIGTTQDHDMSLYYRRARAAEFTFGDTDFHREVVASQLGL